MGNYQTDLFNLHGLLVVIKRTVKWRKLMVVEVRWGSDGERQN